MAPPQFIAHHIAYLRFTQNKVVELCELVHMCHPRITYLRFSQIKAGKLRELADMHHPCITHLRS